MDFTNDVLIHKNINGTEFIQFRKLLEFPNVKHCYTLRKNGINIQVKNGDNTELINSYKKIIESLNTSLDITLNTTFDINNIVKPHQTHTDRVEIVEDTQQNFEEVDGVITNKKDILLCTTSADCTSLLFYDNNKKVVGDVHSGWRGTLKKIGKKAVEKMIQEYDCNPKDIICCIGPCIKKCHFEVEEDVMKLFKNEFETTGKIQEIIGKGRVINGVQKYNIDTTLINKIILLEAGLLLENVIDSGICTVCNSASFHSYRADKEKSGRNGAFIGMMA